MLTVTSRTRRRNAHAYALARMVADNVDERAELRREVERLKLQLEDARERERRRIAREMHDSTVQDLVAVGLMLRRLQDMLEEPDAMRVLGDARGTLGRTQQDLRTLSYLLHPPVLDGEGLVVALKALIRGLANRMKLRIEFECAAPGLRAAAEVENALYRVVQEALINVHKHAAADRAVVRYFREPDQLVLEIEDDGVGMDLAGRPELDCGVGIQGMQARIEQLGGALHLSSSGYGVLVRAEVPIVETGENARPDDEYLLPIPPWKEGLP
jgi:two-component system NarL family sensor kinase